MKKSRLFTAGVLALALVLGLILAGCGDESTAAKVTVIFNKNGANGSAPAEKTVDKGSKITIPDEGGLSLSGSTFLGWNTKKNGSGDLYEEGDRMTVNEDVTLYAQWQQSGNPANPNSGGNNDGSTSGSLTITGFRGYNGKYVCAFGEVEDEYDGLIAAGSISKTSVTAGTISDGKVTLKVWKYDGDAVANFNGNGTGQFSVLVLKTKTFSFDDDIEEDDIIAEGITAVTFSRGVASGAFIDASDLWD